MSLCPAFKTGYMSEDALPFDEDPCLISKKQHPELDPYRALDSSRLRLVGEGDWPLESFLDGPLWLPFQEPAILYHGLPCPVDDVPNFTAESREECLNLAKVWDARGLLALFPEPSRPGFFSRVFNAYKSPTVDRQIGDRRLPNHCEYHISGPAKYLPQGAQLTLIRVPRFKHVIRGSMTDRRDFYHQAQVTPERAATNMLPFDFEAEDLEGLRACDAVRDAWGSRKKFDRLVRGDELRGPGWAKRQDRVFPKRLFPAFKSLFQGDHLGVEFALQSHAGLLTQGGLLKPCHRILGNTPFPISDAWDALVIDDYFALGVCQISSPAEKSFAMKALASAREIYSREKLKGSDEKDVVASQTLKAAGAEIRSCDQNARAGVIPVGAPIAKRIALSVASLRAAALPCISAKLVSRVLGNWVSVLQYRKCLSSVVEGLFKFSAACLEGGPGEVFKLTRAHAQELVLLSVFAPLVFSNVAIDYHEKIFATDASNHKGAIVSAKVPPEVHEALWLDSDRRGSYTHLDNNFRATLRHLGQNDDDNDRPHPFSASPGFQLEKGPLFYFDFVEICGGAGKVSAALLDRGHSVAPVLDLSESRHYDLSSLRLLEWIIYMLEEGRFRSFLVAPPCTSFSPAAHPAVRSYAEPLGFDRRNPKVLHGNILAFRSLVLLRVGRRHRRPCGAEQSRLSKMCWLEAWTSLRGKGFEEAVIASCAFGSPHRKEFRFLVHLLSVDLLDTRCPGGHSHIRIQGQLTKPSAVYTDGLAAHLAEAYHSALCCLQAEERLCPDVGGFESVFANDVMLAADWNVVRAWGWKRTGHINVLELSSAVSNLCEISATESHRRFGCFVDSSVCLGALAKGRSASLALQPLLKRACSVCIGADLYPGWIFSPTRLNTADDPTRDVELRKPWTYSVVRALGVGALRSLKLDGLRRFAANWLRLTLCVLLFQPSDAALSVDWDIGLHSLGCFRLGACLVCLFGLASCLSYAWVPGLSVPSWGCKFGVRTRSRSSFHQGRPFIFLAFAAMVALNAGTAEAMPLAPTSAAERGRSEARRETVLTATRAIKKETLDKRKFYFERFRQWLWEEKSISLRFLLEQKPPDAERVSALLVDYGQELFRAGRSYGIYSETINSIAVARPLIRRQLTSAWDLAFQWLMDEPHSHHPAMPLSVMTAMVTVALVWGWAHEAAVILMSWAGIMRIGEVLAATRAQLVLPGDAAPGTSFMLVMITAPKTRGRSAKHQAARIDQCDVIRFLTAMFGAAPPTAKIWPFSSATLRKRFVAILKALQLPTQRVGSTRPFDLGSMRPGGATYLLHLTENPEYVRRRGRWLSSRVMEVYLQEVFSVTYVEKIKPRARFLIDQCSGAFASVLEYAISFLDCAIPPAVWFHLLRGPAGFPTEKFEESGVDGDVFVA